MKQIIIGDNEAGQRIDRFFGKYLDLAPKSLIQKYIRTKKIKVNKKRTTPDYVLKKEDTIYIYVYDEVLDSYISKKDYKIFDKGLNYVYSDENIAIIHKDSGILMHGDEDETLINLFISDLIKSNEFDTEGEISFTPSFANRLDRNTSGLVVGCKNAESLRLINKLFKERKVVKKYRAIVNGCLDREIDLKKNISKASDELMEIDDKGMEAHSIFTPIKSTNKYSLVEANLITGRKHQLRLHLSYLGYPIIGDVKYGKGEDLRPFNHFGQYLIADKIKFGEIEGSLNYLSNKEFSLSDKYYNSKLEKYYIK